MSQMFARDVTLEKSLPNNIEAERSVLGAILLDNSICNQAMEFLKRDDFYLDSHRRIFEKMTQLSVEGSAIDFITLGEALQRAGELEQVGGVSYLSSLIDGVPRISNLEQYARIVKGKATLRRLINEANKIIATCFEAEDEPQIILDNAEKAIFALADERIREGFTPIKDVAHQQLEVIEKMAGRENMLTGVPTGFTDLDKMTNGLQRTDLIIIAARPSTGKTAFVLTLAQNASLLCGGVIGIYSLEMSKAQLVQRMLCSESRVDAHRLRSGFLNREEWGRLAEGLARLAEARIFIDDTPGISILEMRAKARRLKAEHGLDLLIVDYLQLMSGRGRIESRQQEVSQISRDLKGLAKELEVPVIALSQLSRATETRTDHRPQLSDLRESGCLSGDSLVYLPELGVYRPIKDLVGQRDFKVQSLNLKTWRLEACPVSNAFATGYKPVYRLTTRLGRTIRATANHKFLSLQGWRRLDELGPGSRIALPRQLAGASQSTMSHDELALLGHLIGDGCTLPRHTIQYTTRELELAEKVAGLAQRVFGDAIAPRIKQERNWYQVYLVARQRLTHGKRNPIAKWLDELGVFGLRSYEKRVPEQVFAQPSDGIACFLRHLWATDGCIHLSHGKHDYANIYYASSSYALACHVQSLLLRLGINARRTRHPQTGKGRDQYHVAVTGKVEINSFLEQVGALGKDKVAHQAAMLDFFVDRSSKTNRDIIPFEVWSPLVLGSSPKVKFDQSVSVAPVSHTSRIAYLTGQNLSRERATRLALQLGSVELTKLAESEVYWDKILSIEPDGVTEVYDLTVPSTHNFIANDIIAHNSIEQDADVVGFIFREEMYGETEENRGIAELIIGKQRNGPTGTVRMAFLKEFTRFENLWQG